jgi:hypothetical protein
MKSKALSFGALLILTVTVTTFAIGQQCEDCVVSTGTCHSGLYSCNCSCYSFVMNGVRHCTASGACGPHEICPGPPPVIAQTMMNYPWLTNVGIVKELASHSIMPNAKQIFEEVRTVQLKDGSSSIRRGYVLDTGYRIEGKTPTAATNKTKGTQWWQLTSDDSQKIQVLTLWDDPDMKWESSADIHHSTLRLPITETITFYADHWEQRNLNGVFSDKVEAYVPPKGNGKSSPLIEDDTISLR